MKYRVNIALALTAAGMLLAGTGLADELAPAGKAQTVATDANTVNRDLARKANEAAVEKAVKSVLDSNKLDLDIRLIGPTSVKIAADR